MLLKVSQLIEYGIHGFLQLIKLFVLLTALLTGDEVQFVYRQGTDTTPLWVNTGFYWNGFTGFRI